MGHRELDKLRGKSTVLVSCSLKLHLVLRDCLANDDPPPRLLSVSGWDEHLTRYSDEAQIALLRVGILYSPSRKLWLVRAINSTKAKALGHTATDMRASAMATSLRLSQTLERGGDPAADATVRGLLGLAPNLDYAYRLAEKMSKELGKKRTARQRAQGAAHLASTVRQSPPAPTSPAYPRGWTCSAIGSQPILRRRTTEQRAPSREECARSCQALLYRHQSCQPRPRRSPSAQRPRLPSARKRDAEMTP